MFFELNCRKYGSDCYKHIYWFTYILPLFHCCRYGVTPLSRCFTRQGQAGEVYPHQQAIIHLTTTYSGKLRLKLVFSIKKFKFNLFFFISRNLLKGHLKLFSNTIYNSIYFTHQNEFTRIETILKRQEQTDNRQVLRSDFFF